MQNQNPILSQPPLSFFDKSFRDNPSDVLFCSLNEIDPVFLDNQALSENDFSQPQRVDPRNKLPVARPLCDHTLKLTPELFKSVNTSLLSKKEQSACLAFLQSVKAKTSIVPQQLQCFQETSEKRLKEKLAFIEFLLHYNNANYEKIYSPDKMFVELYQTYYKWKTKFLMENHVDGIFQIYTGFPIPRKCGNSELSGAVAEVKVISHSGPPPRCISLHEDFSKMRSNIETYFEEYSAGNTKKMEINVGDPQVSFTISIEALVFLLCSGDYLDIPTEVLVRVIARDTGEHLVEINDCLPSRNIGVHTGELVVSKCVEVFLTLQETNKCEEIQANSFSGTYSVQTIDEYMTKYNGAPKFNSSTNLVKWILSLGNDGKNIAIVTQTKQGYQTSHLRREVFHSLKLEYKPQFGCEIPSKASLLREWFEQRLSTSSDVTTDRLRINASTFTTVLHESLSLDEIEQELQKHYNVRLPRLLGSLGDFLGLLSKITPGRYILRNNIRFQDKLILYGETKDASSKTCIKLHDLLSETPSDMAFMTSRQLTPIDDSICSAIHKFYKLLPCAFPPWRNQNTKKIIDDRNFILKKVQAKTEIQEAKQTRLAQRRKMTKSIKKKQKRKLKSAAKQEEKNNVQEMEEDINTDKLLYGFEEAD